MFKKAVKLVLRNKNELERPPPFCFCWSQPQRANTSITLQLRALSNSYLCLKGRGFAYISWLGGGRIAPTTAKKSVHIYLFLLYDCDAHKIIKRKNGKQRQSLIIWLIFFLFLQTKPSSCRLFAGPSWTFLPKYRLSEYTRCGGGGEWVMMETSGHNKQTTDRQKLLAGKQKENSQIFNDDFYLPLYLPLW